MPVPEQIAAAVRDLSERSGHVFVVSDAVVPGTMLYVVYAAEHPLPGHYTETVGVLGFRVPHNFPDACPEDSFFIQPATVKLREPDAVTKSNNVHRASPDPKFLNGTPIAGTPALVFSWHLWNKEPWDRRKHTLFDHYTHSLRRFEQPEHD